ALSALPRSAFAQTWPTRPVTVVVFVGAGGTPDIIARLHGQALTQWLGQPMVVDNRPGGGGNLARQAAAAAPAAARTAPAVRAPRPTATRCCRSRRRTPST